MGNNPVGAVLFTLFLYGILGLAYFGWGTAFMSVMAPTHRNLERTHVTLSIWTGWAFTLFLFQLIHFVFPLNFRSVSPVLFLGIALSVFFLIRRYGRRTKITRPGSVTLKHTAVLIVLLVMLLMLSAWLASRSMLTASNYDSGLYHFNAIRWINSFPIVPGLGNLHDRLAYNMSFFSYAAALNLYPLFGHGRCIANSFLWLLTVLTLLEVMLPIFSGKRLASKWSPLQWAAALFCSPILPYWALSSSGIQSPYPDLTSSLLQMVMFVIFCRTVAVMADHARISTGDSILLIFLGATAITIKLSNVAFCGTIMLITFIASVKTSEKRMEDSARLLIPPMLVMMVLFLRGYVLSGAPLFPSTIGYVKTEWSVPIDSMIVTSNVIYSYARQSKVLLSHVFRNWNWLAPWFQRVSKNYVQFVYPAGVFLALSVFNILTAVSGKPRSAKCLSVHWILFVPLLAGLAFWFFMAPDIRFANALFLLLPVSALLLFTSNLQKAVNSRTFTGVICALFLISNLNLLCWAYRNRWILRDISHDGYHAVKRVPLQEKVTRTGLKVYIPTEGEQCWDAPLPCTPFFNEDLRLRKPGVLSSGFTVSGTGEHEGDAERGPALNGDSTALH